MGKCLFGRVYSEDDIHCVLCNHMCPGRMKDYEYVGEVEIRCMYEDDGSMDGVNDDIDLEIANMVPDTSVCRELSGRVKGLLKLKKQMEDSIEYNEGNANIILAFANFLQ